MKLGNGSMPLRLGNLINTNVVGGPFRNCPPEYFGVKMAEEIDAPHHVSVPTRDFCVPEVSDMRKGIMQALMAMTNDCDVYVGCMGGIGRTGLFLGVLAKVQIEYRRSKHRKGRGDDPVGYVRQHFIPHAIETQEQQDFVRTFDVSDIVEWIDVTQRAMGIGGSMTTKAEEDRSYVDEFVEHFRSPEAEVAALVERDLDWIDAIEADSADEAEEVSVSDQVNDMWQCLDEQDDLLEAQRARIEKLETQVSALVDRANKYNNVVTMNLSGRAFDVPCKLLPQEVSDVEKSEEKGLTNPTIFERLRSFWK